MSRYWETETPIEADTGKNVFKYFEQAGKLQISMPYWTNDAGEKKQGKTITVDVAALLETPVMVEVLRQIVGMEAQGNE